MSQEPAGSQPALPASSIERNRPADTIRILVATDNHIGYAEKDPIRGRDSINTFREILRIAVEEDVDMVLLAGDLFHENRPSRDSLYLTIAALREYCLNRRPVSLELISDAGMGISHGFNFPQVNYEDENFNVGLPVFSIHGNHDDPQGVGPDGALCALDILSASGLVNYFGRQDLPGAAETEEEAVEQGIRIRPVLLQKGRTKLALYGVGNVRDERFHYELRSRRVSLFRPAEDKDAWFNILLVHQNRVAHGEKNSVPDNGFGDEVDLVIWGHEHDCRIDAEPVPGKGYYITQPGSSIATSLAKGESIKKHIGLLEILDRDFSFTPIPLKTVRPFIFEDIVLADEEDEAGLALDDRKKVGAFLKDRVRRLIRRAKDEWAEVHADEQPEGGNPGVKAKAGAAGGMMRPLIRLRVEYTKPDGQGSYDVGNPHRFGQEFVNEVANPKDVVQFYRRRRAGQRKEATEIDQPDAEAMDIDGSPDGEGGGRGGKSQSEKAQVSTLVRAYLEAQNLGVLAENGMQRAVAVFVDKDDRDAIKDFYAEALKAAWESLAKERFEDEDALEGQMTKAKERYAEAWEKEAREAELETGRRRQAKGKSKRAGAGSDDDDMSDESSAFGRSMSIGSGAANGQSKDLFNAPSEGSDSDIQEIAPKKAAAKRAPAAKKTAEKKAPAKKAATPAKKTPAKGKQTTLDFSQIPARGASSRAAASKAKSKLAGGASEDEDDDGDNAFEDDSEEDARPKKKSGRGR